MGVLSSSGHFPGIKVTQGPGNPAWDISQKTQLEDLIRTVVTRALTGLLDTVTECKEGVQGRIGRRKGGAGGEKQAERCVLESAGPF